MVYHPWLAINWLDQLHFSWYDKPKNFVLWITLLVRFCDVTESIVLFVVTSNHYETSVTAAWSQQDDKGNGTVWVQKKQRHQEVYQEGIISGFGHDFSGQFSVFSLVVVELLIALSSRRRLQWVCLVSKKLLSVCDSALSCSQYLPSGLSKCGCCRATHSCVW